MNQVPDVYRESAARPPGTPEESGRVEDPRVTQALEDYLAALERGQAPDRQAFLARHAEVAAALAKCLDGLALIQAAGQGTPPAPGPAVTPASATEYPATPLGDFRIVREVGRGGMGVVYEAIQLSLGRRVALKVLPFAAALDPRQLRRFQYEAQAAAHLQHPHIVPVYAVGCERGVHYYAMQFIDGQTLATVIRERRHGAGSQPAAALSTPRPTSPRAFFRTAAQLGLQAAEALEHAHQVGVVHRDIKPANLLVDGSGHLWVTDFGLAQFHHADALTVTGEVMGTARYMSPEQARGQRGLVDHRTDIYSLGVTLYELLTLEPPFTGGDRQEVLTRIVCEEPRPPRRWNKAIPADLETIVLKAMAKDKESRYATAQDLADDLRRFLEDKPIRARRPTLAQRAAKWSRRHKVVVVSAMALLAVAMGPLAVHYVLLRGEQARTEAQRQEAQDNFRLACDAVDQMLTEVGESELKSVPHMEPVRRKLLEKALAFYQTLLAKQGSDPAVRRETARAHRRVGDIYEMTGEHARTRAAYQEAIGLLTELVADCPDEADYRWELATAYRKLGTLLEDGLGLRAEAEQTMRQGLRLHTKLVADFPAVPEYRAELAGSLNNLGGLLVQAGRFTEAEAALREAVALGRRLVADAPTLPGHRLALARSQVNLSTLLKTTGRLREAEMFAQEAIALRRQIAADFPAVPQYRRDLAHSYGSLSKLLNERDQPQAAEAALRDALALRKQLAADFPTVPEYRHDVAWTYLNLAGVLEQLGQPQAAEAASRDALALYKQLAADFPAKPDYRRDLARSHYSLGVLLKNRSLYKEAEIAYREALPIYQQLTAEFPTVSQYRKDLADWHYGLGILLKRTERYQEADGAYREALTFYKQLAAECPSVPAYRKDIADCYYELGILSRRAKQYREAEATYREALAIYKQLAMEYPTAPTYRKDIADCYYDLGILFRRTERYHEAEAACREALTIYKQLAAESPSVPTYRHDIAECYSELGNLLVTRGGFTDAETFFRKALAQYRQLAADFPNDPAYPTDVVDALWTLAWFFATCPDARYRQVDQAVALAQEAVERGPRNGNAWSTLGAARYRTRDWQAAVVALEKAVDLGKGGNSVDWFFLAMARWQLGDQAQARQDYERALKGLAKYRGNAEELRRSHAEAAALLGLPGPTEPKRKEVPPGP